MNEKLESYLEGRRGLVDAALTRYLGPRAGGPPSLLKAMRYSTLAGGKRLRPVLVLAAAECCGGRARDALALACAAEMIHTYSLIHDDLPAMDDDDLRRGRPTSHKVFGEAAAILAGDALLTYAFQVAAEGGASRPRAALAIAALARGAGTAGMVGGQVLDLKAQGSLKAKKGARRLLAEIHARKTGALITACLESGALVAGASAAKLAALTDYGRSLGTAFQVVDDILDVVGDKKLMGKSGSDQDNRKLTYPALYGLERSRAIAEKLAARAQAALQPFGKKAWMLHDLADFVVERQM